MLPDDPKDPNYAANRRQFLRDYAAIPYLRQAQRCVGCGQCAPHCPQAINIPAKIRKVDLLVERLKRDGVERQKAKVRPHGKIPCSFCGKCIPCPYGLDIPGIFGVWNRAAEEGWLPEDPHMPNDAKNGRRFLRAYSRVTADCRQAQRCVGCGLCAERCPLDIDIPGQLRKIDGLVEKLKRNCRA